MMGAEFAYSQRQRLIEKLTRRFAKINEYDIDTEELISEIQHPQIQTWLAMAEAAVEELETEINLTTTSVNMENFLTRHDNEIHMGLEWEYIAKAEGLTEEEINELME